MFLANSSQFSKTTNSRFGRKRAAEYIEMDTFVTGKDIKSPENVNADQGKF